MLGIESFQDAAMAGLQLGLGLGVAGIITQQLFGTNIVNWSLGQAAGATGLGA
tara:strand:- start:5976 stop:6134 length:159 start_codon:yes stop_codon:yes gene_type:complete